MSTYEMNIDTVNSSLAYYQAEKFIYGSSRLGMLKDSVNVLGSAFTDTDSTNVTHTLGNKRYELSNHLGNVLTVITDKPIPHNNGGTVDYWQASIASAYDYSPFGVMLTGRTFEGKQTICEDSTTLITQKTLEEGFSSWGSWTTMGNGLVTYVSGEMQVSNPNSSKKDIGASKAFTTGTGVHNVSFKVIGNTCATVVIWPPSSTPIPIQVIVRDNANNIVASGNYTVAGSYNLSFTPVSSGANYKIEFYMANASAFCFFRLDDVLISYDDATTLTVCKEVDGFYRYGFNNKEKDDEIKGAGNSVNYTYRMHDPRLGRFFAVDPLYAKYPWNSSYAFSENRVIDGVELEGLEFYISKKGETIGQVGNDQTIRMIREGDVQSINITKNLINYANEYESNSFGKTSKWLLDKASEQVKVQDASNDLQDMWDISFKNKKEYAGYVILDTKKYELRFERIEDPKSGPKNVRDPYKAGDFFNGEEGVIVLANVHTHQEEAKYLDKFTDQQIFDAQYNNPKGDGNTAKKKGARYTIGVNNIDYHSPKGKPSSKNNITTRIKLETGKFNLLKDALKQYNGKKD